MSTYFFIFKNGLRNEIVYIITTILYNDIMYTAMNILDSFE